MTGHGNRSRRWRVMGSLLDCSIIQRAAVAWLARRYANPKVRGSNPGLDRLHIFMVEKSGSQYYGLVMFLVVRTPRKTVGPVSDTIWGT